MKRKNYAFNVSSIIVLAIWLFLVGCWIGNIIRLASCDFEPPFKGEIIHAVGLLPGVSVVTVWFSDK